MLFAPPINKHGKIINPDEMDEGDDVEYVRNTPGPDYFVDIDPCGWDVYYYGYDFEGNIRNRREIEATRIYYEARDEEVAAAVAAATVSYEAEAAAFASGVEIPADTPYGVEVDDDMDYGSDVVSDTTYEGEAARLEAAPETEAASRGQLAPEAEIASITELGTVTEIVSEAEIASSTGLAAETEVAPEAEIEVVPKTEVAPEVEIVTGIEVAPEVEIVPGIEVAADTAENHTATQEGEIRTPATPPIVIEISSDESSSDNSSDEDMLRIQPKDIKAAPQPDIVSKISAENSRDTNSNLEQEMDISNINLSEDLDFGPYPRESANSLGLEDEEEYVQPLPESFMDIDPCGYRFVKWKQK
ncbi:hypothetical protein FALBO_366 [Fusarium albosuccineum]|uniref:Uncharacterized protein n=1 Tax=Fusarium albosuccineum TaxID=1237068 RepID=A0A8H4PH64_9HYPO|nr:hypothetical protein FALBO_366 [Fusarium albosuccineum]